MTFCKVLARGKNGNDDITVYEKTEKFENCKKYVIDVSRDGIVRLEENTARTTWKKKFIEWTDEEGREFCK